jgi:ligand-binding SRPBCC domain-containing protein
MHYKHTFIVRAPLEKVANFHRLSASMAAITPPPVIVNIQRAPELLAAGDEMRFTLWLGPLPLRWLARIEDLSAGGFTDNQLEGPFKKWKHQHQFQAIDASRTLVIDQIEAEIKNHWFWGPIGRLMWLNMQVLFAYRGWKTRRLLDS